MKISVLCAGHGAPHAGWVAIDELADLLVHYLSADLLAPVAMPTPWHQKLTGRVRQRFHPVASSGGDVLIVVAHGPADLALLSAIPDVRRKYQKIYAWVTDSYFQAGFGRWTREFDAITVTAHEDIPFVRDQFGIVVHQLYQGTDSLTWAPRHSHAREIDIIGFGRTPPSYHQCFSGLFHTASSPVLYLHSPLGNITGPSVHRERSMLFKLLHRTRISLAFHLYVEPQGHRPRSMMVTTRWLESLLSGCIVAGKRPVSRMADDMLFWDNVTVELDDQPTRAAEQLIDMLARNDDFTAQRRANVRNVVEHHDWRDRIHAMCGLFGIPVPEDLRCDLQRVQELAANFR